MWQQFCLGQFVCHKHTTFVWNILDILGSPYMSRILSATERMPKILKRNINQARHRITGRFYGFRYISWQEEFWRVNCIKKAARNFRVPRKSHCSGHLMSRELWFQAKNWSPPVVWRFASSEHKILYFPFCWCKNDCRTDTPDHTCMSVKVDCGTLIIHISDAAMRRGAAHVQSHIRFRWDAMQQQPA